MRWILTSWVCLAMLASLGCASSEKSADSTPEPPMEQEQEKKESSTLVDILTLKPITSLFASDDDQAHAAVEVEEVEEIKLGKLRRQMADDLHTPGATREEYENRAHLTKIINDRKFNQDVMRVLLLDRPSRALDYPTTLE